jgi:hypothetical protein
MKMWVRTGGDRTSWTKTPLRQAHFADYFTLNLIIRQDDFEASISDLKGRRLQLDGKPVRLRAKKYGHSLHRAVSSANTAFAMAP